MALEVYATLQSVIDRLIAPGFIGSQAALEIKRELDLIVFGLALVRNRHKKMLRARLQGISEIANEQGQGKPDVVVEIAKATADALKRLEEVGGVIYGTLVQAEQLIRIAEQAERRMTYVCYKLGEYQIQLKKIIKQIEQNQKECRGEIPFNKIMELRSIAKHVSGPGTNQIVNALNGIVMVEPFKSRLESADVVCLSRLDTYLGKWQSGDAKKLYTFQRAFKRARSQLKRVARTAPSQIECRYLKNIRARI